MQISPYINQVIAPVLLSTLLAVTGCAQDPVVPDTLSFDADPTTVHLSSARIDKLNDEITALVDAGKLPGAVTLLARQGKVVAFDSFGVKDIASGEPMTKETIFRIYSQTKPITAVAMMILYDQGKWELDDPITKFVPAFSDLKVFAGTNPDGSMQLEALDHVPTMRELMTHTAGFAYGLNPVSPIDKAYIDAKIFSATSSEEFIQRVAALPLANQPGTQWRYSIAVDIQGYIVEQLSGQSLADFMQSQIFAPLKMVDTGFHVPPEKYDRLATLYRFENAQTGTLTPVSNHFMVIDVSRPPLAASGGGGLVSTAKDYALFSQMLLNEGVLNGARILSPEATRLIRTNQLPEAVYSGDGPFSQKSGWGHGFNMAVLMDPVKARTLQGKGTFYWSGAAGTWSWIDPENELLFVGMMHILGKSMNPELAQLDETSARFVYKALLDRDDSRDDAILAAPSKEATPATARLPTQAASQSLAKLSVYKQTLSELLADERSAAIVSRHVPNLPAPPTLNYIKERTLPSLGLDAEKLKAIQSDLDQL